MKKNTILLTIVLLICVFCVFALTACNFEEMLKNADWTEEAEYTDKKSCVGALNSFFEETLKDPDFVVTCKNKNGEVQCTETVKGTSSQAVYNDGSEIFAYKIGEFFYVAGIDREKNDNGEVEETRFYHCSDSTKSGYYTDDEYDTMEDMYKFYYCIFMNKYDGINQAEDLSAENSTFRCVYNGKKENGVTTGSMTFDYTAENYSMKITMDSKENLVQSIHIVISDDSGLNASSDLTWTFVYGGASVTVPDTDAWDIGEAE